MKLSIEKSAFLKALSHGQSVVEKHTTIPILSNVLLHANQNALRLTTTDMDMGLNESVSAAVEQEGSHTVSAQMLFEIVRKLPENEIIHLEFLEDKGQLYIHSGRANFRLSCLPAQDFPKISKTDLPHTFTMQTQTLKRMLDQSRFAISSEEGRYYLNGIYMHIFNDGSQTYLRFVATDAHRLACVQTPIPAGAENIPGVIIGRKTINELMRLLDSDMENITISLSETRIEFRFPQGELSSRLVDGQFPDYKNAIPVYNNKVMITPLEEFNQAAERVATLAFVTDKIRIIKLKAQNNRATLYSDTQELGHASEEFSVDYPYDEPLDIGFNVRYLLDILGQIEGEEAQLMFEHSNAPVLIKGTLSPNSFYVLMPLRV